MQSACGKPCALCMEAHAMDGQRKISGAVIRRLPGYYRYLCRLESEGVERIASHELGQQMGLTASQIRQDINCFGGFGQQGYGYNVPELRQRMGEILGLDSSYRVAIVGAGKIGQAILCYEGFRDMNFVPIAIFDSDPALIGRSVRDLTVSDVSKLSDVLTKTPADIGVVAVPEQHAQKVCDELVRCGVRAIWNFAPIDLTAGHDVAINNVHLSDSLMVLTYSLRHM